MAFGFSKHRKQHGKIQSIVKESIVTYVQPGGLENRNGVNIAVVAKLLSNWIIIENK